jgi:hypothetical protein
MALPYSLRVVEEEGTAMVGKTGVHFLSTQDVMLPLIAPEIRAQAVSRAVLMEAQVT